MMSPVLLARPLRIDDLPHCLDALPGEYWRCNELQEDLLELWRAILEHKATEAFGVFAHDADGRGTLA